MILVLKKISEESKSDSSVSRGSEKVRPMVRTLGSKIVKFFPERKIETKILFIRENVLLLLKCLSIRSHGKTGSNPFFENIYGFHSFYYSKNRFEISSKPVRIRFRLILRSDPVLLLCAWAVV